MPETHQRCRWLPTTAWRPQLLQHPTARTKGLTHHRMLDSSVACRGGWQVMCLSIRPGLFRSVPPSPHLPGCPRFSASVHWPLGVGQPWLLLPKWACGYVYDQESNSTPALEEPVLGYWTTGKSHCLLLFSHVSCPALVDLDQVCQAPGLPGQEDGVAATFLLQGVLPTQGSKPVPCTAGGLYH